MAAAPATDEMSLGETQDDICLQTHLLKRVLQRRVELYTFKPLFPGSSEMDQFQKISMILGKPDNNEWPDAKRLADRKLFVMPDHPKINL